MKREPVAATPEHDKWLDRLLRRQAVAPETDACLDADTLAAWADGGLPASELAAVEVHASNCARCTALMAAMERTAPAAPPSRARLVRWLVPLAAGAAAVAIWVAVPEQSVTPVAPDAASTATQETASLPAAAAPKAEIVETPPPQQATGARADKESLRARDEAQNAAPAQDARLKREVAARAPAEERMAEKTTSAAPAAPAAPAAAPREADALSDTAGTALQFKALNEAALIEAVSSDPLVHWRVLLGVTIERSTDRGKTWTKRAGPSGPIAAITAISAQDALRATVTTANGVRYSTADGGTTWVLVQETPAAPF